ncbi:IS481 family transposase [Phyllobacterium phragmitis]|uniref:IS481 family transposase n=1 Tax=Phyllobacterium phragmitis TaxID=2670329 RepID=A0A2S9IJC1_9HYPH|nr:helix-turn-helix domain-containing protein [Phyllobacterium phragmitis]PRD40626.1 IS481 family transposase [Phyllobacterium phragmitis]
MVRAVGSEERSERDAASELAEHRLSVLELAKELDNVAEACRRRGLDRTSFYEWKRRFQAGGFEGLKDQPPVAKNHPMKTPAETVARVRELALQHPSFGCNRLEAMLALDGRRVSAITIQKILNDAGLGSQHHRWLALEAQSAGRPVDLTTEQAAFVEKLNPCFRERHVESKAPGELLVAQTFFVGSFEGIGKIYLHAVVDTYGSYAFGLLQASRQLEVAVAVLHGSALPFFRKLGLSVAAVLTHNTREFRGADPHPYELYLKLNGIEHRRPRAKTSRTNGFIERFNAISFNEFFRIKMRDNFYDTVDALQADFDQWLTYYNTERSHLGYRNQGRSPIEAIHAFADRGFQDWHK